MRQTREMQEASKARAAKRTAPKKKVQVEDHRDFFIGYQKLPNKERRFLILGVPLLAAAAGGLGSLLARQQNKPDPAIWGKREVAVEGRLVRHPYPHLLVPNDYSAIGYDTMLLVARGKHGAKGLLEKIQTDYATVTGKILNRHDLRYNSMMEVTVAEERRGIFPNPVAAGPPQEIDLYKIRGRIVDSKCHFGVMRPSVGLTHKACAALCVRGGIPPIFVPHTTKLDRVIIARTEGTVNGDGAAGGAAGANSAGSAGAAGTNSAVAYDYPNVEQLLPYMLDLIEAEGRLALINNHYEFLIDPATIKVIASC